MRLMDSLSLDTWGAEPAYHLPMPISDSPFPAIPTAGRDYALLLEAMAHLVDVLTSEGEPQDAMREIFEGVVQGFGAEKALILIPKSQGPVRFDVLASTPRVKPAQIAAVRAGQSAEGISSSMIQAVLRERQPAIVEHPMLLAGAARTAAFAQQGNYSAMCAPVLDATRLEVRALWYVQNTGPDLTRAYRHIDLRFLIALVDLMGRLFVFQSELSTAAGYPGLALRDIRARITERVVRQRIRDCGGNYKKAAQTLGLSRAAFYRLLEFYSIPNKGEQRLIDRAGAEGGAQVDAAAEGADGENTEDDGSEDVD